MPSNLATETWRLELAPATSPILRAVAQPVVPADVSPAFIADMLRVLRQTRGVGLAATQVGIAQRVVVIDTVAVDQLPEILLNPAWAAGYVTTTATDVEGCLSVPGGLYVVERYLEVFLLYQDLHGERQERLVSGFAARVIQHECDHLDGKLISDGRFRPFGGAL